MSKPSLVRDFIGFVRHEKKWWLIPLLAVLVIVSLLAIAASSSALSPFIYTLF
jgi:uncharacterized membrane protein YjdF